MREVIVSVRMDVPNPFITIICPVYNSEKSLERAVETVLSQTFSDWELILINDASTDNSKAIMHRYEQSDERIRAIYLEQNQGQSHARNCGIDEAKGEWITLLDADDAYADTRLQGLVDIITAENVDMLADNLRYYDAYAEQEADVALKKLKDITPWTLESHLCHDQVGKDGKWGLLKVCVKRDFVNQYNIRYREQFRMAEDSLFYLELLMHQAKAVISAAPTYIYTSAVGRISGERSGNSTSNYRLNDHMQIFDYFEEVYIDQLNRSIKRSIKQCRHNALVWDKSQAFKRRIRQRKKMTETFFYLVKYPGITRYLFASLMKYLKRRRRYAL